MARRAVAIAVAALGLVFAAPGRASAAPPVCKDDAFIILPNTTLTLTEPNCTDFITPFTWVIPPGGQPLRGTATDGNRLVYTPTPGLHGPDEFKYQILDAGPFLSNTATIKVLVDTPPTCRPASATVQANTSLVLPDVDCTDADGDDITILVDKAQRGTVSFPGDGSAVYTPPPGYVGPDSLLFAAEDIYEIQSADATMNILVTAPPAPQPTVVPTPPPAPKDLSAPTVALKNASKKQAMAITVTTNENASATLTVALDKATARKLKLSRTVGTLKAALKPGTSTLKVKLSSKAAKAFKKLKSVKLTVTAVVADTGGNQTTKTLKVTLKK